MKNKQNIFLIIIAVGIIIFLFGVILTIKQYEDQSIKNGSIVVLEKGGSIRLAKPSEIDSPDINLGVVTVNVTRYSWGGTVKEINTKDLDK